MIRYSEIAQFLNKELSGIDGYISSYCTLSDIRPNCVVFTKKYDRNVVERLNDINGILAIVTPDYKDQLNCSYIISENPRLNYLNVIQEFFVDKTKRIGVHAMAIIEEGALIAKDVYIGANSSIGEKVQIGDGGFLEPNVVISGECIIGKNVYIKSGVVIGQSGFGFERDKDGVPVHFPHMGRVVIGDNVYIGANTAIDRGTLGDTIIEDNVKIDNLVHVAHNCRIGSGSFIIAGTILGGGVCVGKNCWIAPNVAVKQQVKIGDCGYVGLGAVVIRDVEENVVVVGNPAKKLQK